MISMCLSSILQSWPFAKGGGESFLAFIFFAVVERFTTVKKILYDRNFSHPALWGRVLRPA